MNNKNNFNINDDILNAAKSGNTDKLINSLSNDDKEKLNKILNDKNALNEILKSPQAAAIMKLLGGKNG